VAAGLRHLGSPEQVDAALHRLYGTAAMPGHGVVQVVAVAERTAAEGDRELDVIRIGPDAPRSDTDFFVLNLVRAWADAIVVSGEIIRREPELSYALGERPDWQGTAGTLRDWRERRGFVGPQVLVVLTRSGDLPLDHPVWTSIDRAEIHTGREGERKIGDLARARGIGMFVSDDPGPRRVVTELRARGRRCSIETGPRSSAPLYGSPGLVDEVFRSVYTGRLLEAAVGPRFSELEEIELGPWRARSLALEEGPWRFERWTRDRPAR